jgi:hypothetical protein
MSCRTDAVSRAWTGLEAMRSANYSLEKVCARTVFVDNMNSPGYRAQTAFEVIQILRL